jgi:hypothetical protein
VTISGDYRGYGASGEFEVINADWTVTITASGVFSYSNGDETITGLTFYQGLTRNLDDGLSVTFLDALSDYDTDDEFSFHVGPRTWWVSGSLDPGTYTFGVKAYDKAGNESATGAEVTVEITGEPAEVTAVSGSYASNDVTLTWTDGADTDEVRIYSNYDKEHDVLRDYIMETNPVATISAGTETATITTGSVGVAKFYLRAVNSGGIEEKNFNLVEVDARDNPVSASVASPFDLQAVAIAGGKARVSWSVEVSDATPASFNLYTFTSEPDAADVTGATPDSVATDLTVSGQIGSQSTDTDALAGVRWFVVRSVDSDGNEDGNIVSVSVTPDSTAPGTVGGLGSGAV